MSAEEIGVTLKQLADVRVAPLLDVAEVWLWLEFRLCADGFARSVKSLTLATGK